VELESVNRLEDRPDGIRLVRPPERGEYCLEVGALQGPHLFVFLPPAPSTVEAEVVDIPLLGAGPMPVELTLRCEPLAESLLAYTHAGLLTTARTVADSATLDDETLGANTALVLAYFFLRTLELDRAEQWLKRFDETGVVRPDSDVIRGWRSLRSERPDVPAAARYFVAAGRNTSPPVYTEGLRLLIDGLELVAVDPEDSIRPDLTESRHRASAWGGAAEWDRVLTTVRGTRPDNPLPGTRQAGPRSRDILAASRLVPGTLDPY
jgi:hypothetical protein